MNIPYDLIYTKIQKSKTNLWWGSVVKNPPCQCYWCMFNPWVEKSPWRRNGNRDQYSCLGNLMDKEPEGYSPWGHKRVEHNLVTEQPQQESTLTQAVIYLLNLVIGIQWLQMYKLDFSVCMCVRKVIHSLTGVEFTWECAFVRSHCIVLLQWMHCLVYNFYLKNLIWGKEYILP